MGFAPRVSTWYVHDLLQDEKVIQKAYGISEPSESRVSLGGKRTESQKFEV